MCLCKLSQTQLYDYFFSGMFMKEEYSVWHKQQQKQCHLHQSFFVLPDVIPRQDIAILSVCFLKVCKASEEYNGNHLFWNKSSRSWCLIDQGKGWEKGTIVLGCRARYFLFLSLPCFGEQSHPHFIGVWQDSYSCFSLPNFQ